MSLFIRLAIMVAAGASVYFLLRAIGNVAIRRTATKLELTQAKIDEQGERSARKPWKQRFSYWLARSGYAGSIGPILLGITFVYLLLVLAQLVVGIPAWIALLASLPLTYLGGIGVVSYVANKRKNAFDKELLDLLENVASQVEIGSGPERALAQAAAMAPEPLHSELTSTLDRAAISQDLVAECKALEDRYPSRGLQLFVSALEISRDMGGGELAPTLRRSADILRRDFDVRAEAKAEISQAKGEFWGVVGIVGLVVYLMISAAGIEYYVSPLGLIVMVVCGANFIWGLYRFNRLVQRISQI